MLDFFALSSFHLNFITCKPKPVNPSVYMTVTWDTASPFHTRHSTKDNKSLEPYLNIKGGLEGSL